MIKHINNIEYELIDPTGNITALVRTATDIADQPRIASLIMDSDSTCEQVGFISDSDTCDINLRMAAGEFCGNAVMSTAALYCDDKGLAAGKSMTVTVASSGCSDPVEVDITRKESDDPAHIYTGHVSMPHPQRIQKRIFTYKGREYDLPVVEFDGISHIVTRRRDIRIPDDELTDVIKEWCAQADALGLGILLTELEDEPKVVSDNGTDTITTSMNPLVYVPELSSCFWENSCASGTTAVAAYLKDKLKRDNMNLSVRQRGGVLTVSISKDKFILGGTVRI